MNRDLGKSFDKLVNYFQPLYRGVVVERRDGGYVYARHFYATKEELDAAIDLHILHLEHSINRIKTQQ
jgi:hypothetical protein